MGGNKCSILYGYSALLSDKNTNSFDEYMQIGFLNSKQFCSINSNNNDNSYMI